jgi:putative RecB family exonuclease
MTRARDRLIIASADRYARSLGNKDERISPFVTQALEPGSIAIVRKDFVQERVVHARRPDAPVRAQDVQPSVHDLKAFRDCPRQYQYRAVWRMPVHQTPAQWFGSLLHGVLEGAGRLRLEGEEVGGTQLAAWFEEAWLKAPRAYLRGDRPDLRSLGAELLTRYGDSELWTRARLSAVEEPFTLRRSQVRGRIDRIDEGPEVPIIVDYKAGTAPADAGRLSGDLQVRSYALRGAEMAGREEAVVELHYLQDLRAVRVHFDAGMLRTAGGHVGATADDIRRAHAAGDFPMKPGDWVCGACPYSTVCTKGKR